MGTGTIRFGLNQRNLLDTFIDYRRLTLDCTEKILREKWSESGPATYDETTRPFGGSVPVHVGKNTVAATIGNGHGFVKLSISDVEQLLQERSIVVTGNTGV